MNPTLKYNLTKAIADNLFKNSDKLCETSSNNEAISALFELKMKLWSELRNLLNVCNSEEDITYMLPEQLKKAASGYTFIESVYYVPTDNVRRNQYLTEKVDTIAKEQRILEMLIS